MEKVIIAVDAGGTKTKAVAIDENKKIVYEIVGGPGSPAVVGHDAIKTIFQLVEVVNENVKDKYNVSFVQIGLSGYGVLGDNARTYEKELEEKINAEVNMTSDTNLGLYSIVEDKYNEGVLVISGTGSAVAGIKDEKTMLVGGYGVLLTETGSSYAAVKMLIVNTINQFEDNMTYSEIGREFLELIEGKDVNDFRRFMYTKSKAEIASYSKFISAKALDGDEIAVDILKKCGKDLAIQVKKLYNNLKLSDETVIGFVGSFIKKAPYAKDELIKTLEEFNIKPIIFTGDDDPVYGGYYMAKRKGKI